MSKNLKLRPPDYGGWYHQAAWWIPSNLGIPVGIGMAMPNGNHELPLLSDFSGVADWFFEKPW